MWSDYVNIRIVKMNEMSCFGVRNVRLEARVHGAESEMTAFMASRGGVKWYVWLYEV